MAQEHIMFNGSIIKQPDEFTASFTTTATSDSGRTQDGVAHYTPMFTVESFAYKATDMKPAEAAQILRIIVGRSRFEARYFSPFYGAWRNDYFYVSQGSIECSTLRSGSETLTELSFNMIGINPL